MQRDTLRDLVERWRGRTGLGIDDLARLVGAHRSRVYRWLAGTAQPEVSHLDGLSRALKLRLAEVAAAMDETLRRKEGIPA